MALLQWVPELDTGIAEIDTQHKRIVDYINKLHELRQTHHRERLAEVIAEMVDYTISHFAFEEALMESAGYMFSGPHKRCTTCSPARWPKCKAASTVART